MLHVNFISILKLWVTLTFYCINKGCILNLTGYYSKRYTFLGQSFCKKTIGFSLLLWVTQEK